VSVFHIVRPSRAFPFATGLNPTTSNKIRRKGWKPKKTIAALRYVTRSRPRDDSSARSHRRHPNRFGQQNRPGAPRTQQSPSPSGSKVKVVFGARTGWAPRDFTQPQQTPACRRPSGRRQLAPGESRPRTNLTSSYFGTGQKRAHFHGRRRPIQPRVLFFPRRDLATLVLRRSLPKLTLELAQGGETASRFSGREVVRPRFGAKPDREKPAE